MSLVVAIPCGVASAIAYGASTAVQHSAAHTGRGRPDTRGLVRLLRDPRWLASVGGDVLGLVLQVVALSTGPVVIIQPLLVLAIPVSLPVGFLLGGPRPRASDVLACVAILASLLVFFLLLGAPGTGRIPAAQSVVVAVTCAFVLGSALCVAVRTRTVVLRAGVYGGIAGVWFGLVGVLLNALSVQVGRDGVAATMSHVAGITSVLGIVILGGLGMVLIQIAFQVGSLAASFPASETAAPVAAVILGVLLLHEQVPVGGARVVVYLACLAVIVLGAVHLASATLTRDPL